MTQQADTSGSLALSTRSRDAFRPVSENLVNGRTLRTARVLDSAQRAEIAQARVFERLLQAESTELQELAARATDERSDSSDTDSVGELTQVRARLDEIYRLLRALRGRFPHAAPGLDDSLT
jgi:hypothetical protein